MNNRFKYSILNMFVIFENVLAIIKSAERTQVENKTRISRVVKITSGFVRGYQDEADIIVFYGIPYATAPTGHDKFQPPLPAPEWNETLEAVDKGIVCPQHKDYIKGKRMQEDCLIANVYVPNTKKRNLPVLVQIHKGAYQMGYGNMQKPKHLVKSKRIVAVNFNYRLSAHGFLCLGTEKVPGNAGMKDQVALLRWVKENIASFGGNPKEVTITGSHAGSSAVDLLILSKMAKGLFNKVIPQSGANVGVWSVQMDPIKVAISHATKFKFEETQDIHAIENFYINADSEKLANKVILQPDNTFGFVPCIERKVQGKVRFLHDAPVDILKSGDYAQVPMLYGFSAKEGKYRRLRDKMNTTFSNYLPADLKFNSTHHKKEIARKVKKFYFGLHKDAENYTKKAYVAYFSDILFVYPTLRAVKLHIKAGHEDIYLYEYSYGGGQPSAPSVAVLDEGNEMALDKEYRKVKHQMRKLWLSFITTGVLPETMLPKWLLVRTSELQPRISFWHKLYNKYYRKPIPPRSLVKNRRSKANSKVQITEGNNGTFTERTLTITTHCRCPTKSQSLHDHHHHHQSLHTTMNNISSEENEIDTSPVWNDLGEFDS